MEVFFTVRLMEISESQCADVNNIEGDRSVTMADSWDENCLRDTDFSKAGRLIGIWK